MKGNTLLLAAALIAMSTPAVSIASSDFNKAMDKVASAKPTAMGFVVEDGAKTIRFSTVAEDSRLTISVIGAESRLEISGVNGKIDFAKRLLPDGTELEKYISKSEYFPGCGVEFEKSWQAEYDRAIKLALERN